MTSKAEKQRRKRTFRAMPQRRGRPLTANALRHPGGKIKFVEEKTPPCPATLALRAKIAGDDTPQGLRAAENPLDTAKHRGWISDHEHRAGELLADNYRRSGIELPGLRAQDLAKVSKAHSAGMGDADAMNRVRAVVLALRSWPKARAAVFSLCVLGEWPSWMVARIVGQSDAGIVARSQLRCGLRLIAGVLGVGVADQRRAA
jgi:hypothetical protein